MLDKNGLIPNVQIFTGLIICTPGCSFRIGTVLDLGFNLFEGRFEAVLTLL